MLFPSLFLIMLLGKLDKQQPCCLNFMPGGAWWSGASSSDALGSWFEPHSIPKKYHFFTPKPQRRRAHPQKSLNFITALIGSNARAQTGCYLLLSNSLGHEMKSLQRHLFIEKGKAKLDPLRMAPQLSWLERRANNAKVTGSIPLGASQYFIVRIESKCFK